MKHIERMERVAMKNYNKSELMIVLDQINIGFHKHIFNVSEKNGLLKAVTGHLSAEQASMIASKLRYFPDEMALLRIVDYFQEKGEEIC